MLIRLLRKCILLTLVAANAFAATDLSTLIPNDYKYFKGYYIFTSHDNNGELLWSIDAITGQKRLLADLYEYGQYKSLKQVKLFKAEKGVLLSVDNKTWITNGLPEGSVKLNYGAIFENYFPGQDTSTAGFVIDWNGKITYTVRDPSKPISTVYYSDGTSKGTFSIPPPAGLAVLNSNPDFIYSSILGVANNKLIIQYNNSIFSFNDETKSLVKLVDISTKNSIIELITQRRDNGLYFRRHGEDSYFLFTDGTQAGTVPFSGYPDDLQNSRNLFSKSGSSLIINIEGLKLVSTEGIKKIFNQPAYGIYNYAANENFAVFGMAVGNFGCDIWYTDATEENTYKITTLNDLCPRKAAAGKSFSLMGKGDNIWSYNQVTKEFNNFKLPGDDVEILSIDSLSDENKVVILVRLGQQYQIWTSIGTLETTKFGAAFGILNLPVDICLTDIEKREPLTCGCGTSEIDTDLDGTLDCIDLCPADPAKILPGDCGCGKNDVDFNNNGKIDCIEINTVNPIDIKSLRPEAAFLYQKKSGIIGVEMENMSGSSYQVIYSIKRGTGKKTYTINSKKAAVKIKNLLPNDKIEVKYMFVSNDDVKLVSKISKIARIKVKSIAK